MASAYPGKCLPFFVLHSHAKYPHLQTACNFGRNKVAQYSAANLWTFVGEFTAAPYDCAKYLNGRGVGARYDGTYPGSPVHGSCANVTGSCANFSDEYKTFLGQFYEAQVSSFEEGGQGWFYWTWKVSLSTVLCWCVY